MGLSSADFLIETHFFVRSGIFSGWEGQWRSQIHVLSEEDVSQTKALPSDDFLQTQLKSGNLDPPISSVSVVQLHSPSSPSSFTHFWAIKVMNLILICLMQQEKKKRNVGDVLASGVDGRTDGRKARKARRV
jgi:hypothetical protein